LVKPRKRTIAARTSATMPIVTGERELRRRPDR
jgi:hypothetical protein